MLTKWLFVNIFICKQLRYKNVYLSICLEISNINLAGLAMLGSLAMCTVYTNTFTFGQLKLIDWDFNAKDKCYPTEVLN